MEVTERRIVYQEWFETDETKTGWDSFGWFFRDEGISMNDEWTIINHIRQDKHGRPTLAIAEKTTTIE